MVFEQVIQQFRSRIEYHIRFSIVVFRQTLNNIAMFHINLFSLIRYNNKTDENNLTFENGSDNSFLSGSFKDNK